MQGMWTDSIKHAKPALTVWAVCLVSSLVWAEGQQMIRRETGLHLRASEKSMGGPNARVHAKCATWDAVDSFSLGKMQKIAKINAPVLWEIVSSYVNPEYGALVDNQAVAIHRYWPQNVVRTDSASSFKTLVLIRRQVCTSAIMLMTFGCSDRANLYALCRGIWYFAVKAHHSIFRVESHMGQSVA
ncbi:hypothetical protein L208DRAFT_1392366, partial [Tricholoma matsutake]